MFLPRRVWGALPTFRAVGRASDRSCDQGGGGGVGAKSSAVMGMVLFNAIGRRDSLDSNPSPPL